MKSAQCRSASTDLLPKMTYLGKRGWTLSCHRGNNKRRLLMLIRINLKGIFVLPNLPFSHFHTTSYVAQLPAHRLYKSVDWEKVEAGFHAVVDPMEPGSILYLSEQDYIRQLRVSLSNDHTLKVLAKAGTAKATSLPTSSSSTPTSQNSPINTHPFLDEFFTGKRKSRTQAIKRVVYLFKAPYQDLLSAKRNFEGTVKALMIPVTDRNIRTLLVRWFTQLTFWKTGSKANTLHRTEVNTFSLYLARIVRTQGVNAVISRLKIGLFTLNSYMGGKRLLSTQNLGLRIRLRHGLPAFIPLYARNGIRAHSLRFIHIWVSILNAYKVMLGTWPVPPLGSITAPHPDFSGNEVFSKFLEFIPLFWEALGTKPIRNPKELSMEDRSRPSTKYDILFTAKSGPNRGPALLTVGADAFAWRCQPRNFVLEWLNLVGADIVKTWFENSASVWASNACSPLRRKEEISDLNRDHTYIVASGPAWTVHQHRELLIRWWKGGPYGRPILRRLHALYEAAGKVRLIAIVDYWTQLCLKPLHSWMFSILKAMPQDATFNQEGKLREFSKRDPNANYFCYDLKSATDLIPLRLYEELFRSMFPKNILSLWLELLVGLPFVVPKECIDDRGMSGVKNPSSEDLDDLHRSNEIKYTCGQPMGALSSWASMALVHHALVWYAAWTVGLFCKETVPLPRWSHFTSYLILGDDIVIANKEVAEAYSSICTALGIRIGLAKSYTDSPLLNFANQTYLKDVNISPLSLREELNVKGLPSRSEMALRAVRRGYVDLGGNRWVAPLIKLFVHPITWELIQLDLNRGINHPLVSWILSALLAPATNRLSVVKPAASIKEYLATMSRKVLFWNKPLKDLASTDTSKGSSEFTRIFLLKQAQRIIRDVENIERRLESFEPFVLRTASADISSILLMAYQTSARRTLHWWRREYNAVVKLVIRGSSHTLDDYAYARFCDVVSLDELIPILYQAEHNLPQVPSFEGKTLKDFFSSSRMADETKIFKIYLRQMEILRATDDLFEGSSEMP